MKIFTDILIFERMIAPILLQILFWAGRCGTFYGTYILIDLNHWAWWLVLILGSLSTRVFFEITILAFRSFERLGDIRDALVQGDKMNSG